MVDDQDIERAVERARRAAEAVRRAQSELSDDVRGLREELEAARRAREGRQPAPQP